MKIVVIASNQEILIKIKSLLQDSNSNDQFIFLQRQNHDLRLDRIDLHSTSVLIIDSKGIDNSDLRNISSFTRENANPAVIYMTGNYSESELLNAVRSGVTEIIHAVSLDNDLPAAIERLRSIKYISTLQKPRGRIVSFISCKGGSGATFIATNLGYVLAAENAKKVLLIDLHLQFGDASFYLLEEQGPTTLSDIVTKTGLDSTVIATAAMQIRDNYYLLQAPDSTEESLSIVASHIDNLLTIAVQDYDFVIVDLPLIVDSLVMKTLDRSDLIYIVMQPMVLYMRAMTKISNFFNKLGYEQKKIKIVLNRVNEGKDLPIPKIEDAIQNKVAFKVSNNDSTVVKSLNIGKPILAFDAKNEICDDLRLMANELTGEEGLKATSSFFKKMFS